MDFNSIKNIKFAEFAANLQKQFQDLDPKDPSVWPPLPRYFLCVGLTVLVIVALWFLWLQDSDVTLEKEKATEVQLREDFKKKLTQVANLDALKKQREQVQQYVTQLEKQLPSKAEMDALLSDVNQAGLGRSLQFETFRPGQVTVREYYAELPIALRVTGRYHDIGSFTSDIAHLSRIVTLNNLNIVPIRDGMLAMDATAKTFRYLDPDELAAQHKPMATPAQGGAKK